MVRYEGQVLSARVVQLTDLGVNLFRRRRLSKGITFSAIAFKSSVSEQSIRRLFRGHGLRATTFSKIAEILFEDEDVLLSDRYVVAVDPNKPWPKGISKFKRAA